MYPIHVQFYSSAERAYWAEYRSNYRLRLLGYAIMLTSAAMTSTLYAKIAAHFLG